MATVTSTPHDSPAPATAAAARAWRVSAGLGLFGVLSAAVVVIRLAGTWRVTPAAAAHQLSIFGQRLSYPTANGAAIVMVVLAAVGLAVTGSAFWAMLREASRSIRLRRALGHATAWEIPGAVVISDDRPRAFCAGLVRPRVYISTAALAMLDARALAAVLAHEHQHARRRDPLRLAAGRVYVKALAPLPGLRTMTEHQWALAELSADESAVAAQPANRSGLATAMLAFSDAGPAVGGVDLTRVDRLLGEPWSCRLPLWSCLLGAATVAVMLAVGLLAGQVAQGSASLAPPVLSAQPCVIVLAVIPAAIALIAVGLRRSRH